MLTTQADGGSRINLLAGIIKHKEPDKAHLPGMTQAPRSIELPPPDTKLWVLWRKAAVVRAVHIGMISLCGACLRYNISVEEFLAWQRAVDAPSA